MSSPDITRIIDASLNRIGEGLRVLEDVARLLLDDESLTQQLKTMRHDLVRGDLPFNQKLLESRNSESDIGIDITVAGETKQKELPTIVIANSRRVQESLRTLEELSKTPNALPGMDSEKFKHARFNLYTLEQKLVLRLLRQEKLRRLTGLYAIIDTQALKGRSHLEVARQIISGGSKIIQLRDKYTSKKELLPVAQELKKLCESNNVLFIVNDHLDLALACNADGLHLGQDDLPVDAARKLLPVGTLLGCSTHSVEEALTARQDGADYIAIGSVFPTTSKQEFTLVGLEGVRQVRQALKLPVVAIGGIDKDNASEVIAAGANAVAVISAILGVDDVETATRQIIERIEAKK